MYKILSSMKKDRLQAIVYILIGAFFVYWAQSHSPKAGIGQVIGNEISGSYTMSETWYYITLAIGAVLAIWGVFKLIRK